MIEEDLKKLWLSPANKSGVMYDKDSLINGMKSDLSRFKTTVKLRDWREIGAALLMFPLFLFVAIYIPIVLSQIGAGIIAAGCVLVIVKILMAKKGTEIDTTDSYINYLKAARVYLIAQRRLLDTVLYWYILPFVVGLLLFFMGFDLSLKQRIMYVSITTGIGVVTYLLNRYAVRKGVLPRIEKVDKIINELVK